MKPLRAPETTAYHRIRRRASESPSRSLRECLVLGDPTDSLLDAYDCVALRAYDNFLAHGPRAGGELEDWLSAERELLLGFQIDLHETDQFVYALAGVPGVTASRISVAVESRWIVILVRLRHDSRGHSTARDSISVEPARQGRVPAASSLRPAGSDEPRPADAKQIDTAPREKFGTPPLVSDDRRAQSVCVLGLPAAVDGSRSIAVLADGLLGIRMAKLHT